VLHWPYCCRISQDDERKAQVMLASENCCGRVTLICSTNDEFPDIQRTITANDAQGRSRIVEDGLAGGRSERPVFRHHRLHRLHPP
jgi:hypothetical protein